MSPAAAKELAQYLRKQAEICLQLAGKNAVMSELVVLAASMHDRATKLEQSLGVREDDHHAA